MLRTALKFGLIAGATLTAVIIVPFFFQSYEGLEPAEIMAQMRTGELIGYGTMVLAMGLVAFAIREQRGRSSDPFGFGSGFVVGATTSAVAATVFGLATALLYLAMGPDRTDEFMRLYMMTTLGPNPDPQLVSQTMADYEARRGLWLNPWFQGFVMFMTVLPIGLVVSALSAWFLRRPASPAVDGQPDSA